MTHAAIPTFYRGNRAMHRPGVADFHRRRGLMVLFGMTVLFLYGPIVTLIAFSFNDSRRNVVWRGFTTEWYARAWEDDSLVVAFANSLTIAGLAMLLSLVLGVGLGMGLERYRFRGRKWVETLTTLPIVIPEICLAVALFVFLQTLELPSDLAWPLNLGVIALAHTTFCLPFVCLVIRVRMASLGLSQEEAARDLGANEWEIVRDVRLPHLRPALIAGAMLAFTLSIDDFVITFFLSTPGTETFPVKVYSMVRFSVTPVVNAASTVLIVITMVLTLIGVFMMRKIRSADG